MLRRPGSNYCTFIPLNTFPQPLQPLPLTNEHVPPQDCRFDWVLFFFNIGGHQDIGFWTRVTLYQTQPNVNQTEGKLAQLWLVAWFIVLWAPPLLEGSPPSPPLPFMLCYELLPAVPNLTIHTPTGTAAAAGYIAWHLTRLPLQALTPLLSPCPLSLNSLCHAIQ